uniref:Uncharacterized protein n=1 Tax=Parastrongyloides trichosuri TaxID=131310 RepID=A0A0N4ZB30_PARTI
MTDNDLPIESNIIAEEDITNFNFIWELLNLRQKYEEVVHNVNYAQDSLQVTKDSYVNILKKEIEKLEALRDSCSKSIIKKELQNEKNNVDEMMKKLEITNTADEAKKCFEDMKIYILSVTDIENTDNCLREGIKTLSAIIDKNLWKNNDNVVEKCISEWLTLKIEWSKLVVMYEKDIIKINEEGENCLLNYFQKRFQETRLIYVKKIQDRFHQFLVNQELLLNGIINEWNEEKKIWEKKIDNLVKQRLEQSMYLSQLPYEGNKEVFSLEKELFEIRKKISLLKIKNSHNRQESISFEDNSTLSKGESKSNS